MHLYADFLIKTSSGSVDGYKKGGTIYWDDIPYAEAPIGNLRWKAPVPIKNSNKLINPRENNFCIQKTSSLGGSSQFSDTMISGTEDCLYLDIVAPKILQEKLCL